MRYNFRVSVAYSIKSSSIYHLQECTTLKFVKGADLPLNGCWDRIKFTWHGAIHIVNWALGFDV